MAEKDVVVTLAKPLEDVEDRQLLPPDRYEAEAIAAGPVKRGPKDDYVPVTFVLYGDGMKGLAYENFSLAEAAEFKIKQYVAAISKEPPKGAKLNFTKTLGRKFLAEVTIEDYEDPQNPGKTKKKNSIAAFWKLPPAGEKAEEKETKSKKGKEEEVKEEDEVSFG